MNRQNGIVSVIAAIGLVTLLGVGTVSADTMNIPNSFSAGTPAVAAEVNANFSEAERAANDNFSRIMDNATSIGDLNSDVTDLQAGSRPADRTFIDIDCNADPDTLISPPYTDNFYPYTTFNITGDCNGPLYIVSDGVRLVGAEANRAASIVLPNPVTRSGFAADNGAVFADGAHDLRIENMTIDASAWSDSAALGTDAAGVYARNAFVRLIDVDIVGGLYALNPFRNAIVRLQGVVNISEFVHAGASAGDHSLITTRGQVNIGTTLSVGTTYIIGVEAYRLGIIDFRAGVTINMPAQDFGSNVFPMAMTSGSGSHIRVRDSGTNTINGRVNASSNATLNLAGVDVSGDMVSNGGTVFVSNSTQSDGEINVGSSESGSSIMNFWNSTIASGIDDDVSVGTQSTLTLNNTNVGGAAPFDISVGAFSMLTLGGGSTDMNNNNIFCDTQGSLNNFSGINVGTVNGC